MNSTKATFKRYLPPADVQQPRFCQLPLGVFRVNSKLLGTSVAAKDDSKGRNSWWRIKGPRGVVYRVLYFDQHLRTRDVADIDMDWYGWCELVGYRTDATDGEVELQLRRVRWWEWPAIAWNHVDPHTRIGLRVSLVSIWLSIILFLLGLMI